MAIVRNSCLNGTSIQRTRILFSFLFLLFLFFVLYLILVSCNVIQTLICQIPPTPLSSKKKNEREPNLFWAYVFIRNENIGSGSQIEVNWPIGSHLQSHFLREKDLEACASRIITFLRWRIFIGPVTLYTVFYNSPVQVSEYFAVCRRCRITVLYKPFFQLYINYIKKKKTLNEYKYILDEQRSSNLCSIEWENKEYTTRPNV